MMRLSTYPRAMIVYSWLLAIIFIVIGRMLHQSIRHWLRDRGMGKDRLLVVGTGDTARIMLQRILWSPQLGYELVGVINGDGDETEFLGCANSRKARRSAGLDRRTCPLMR